MFCSATRVVLFNAKSDVKSTAHHRGQYLESLYFPCRRPNSEAPRSGSWGASSRVDLFFLRLHGVKLSSVRGNPYVIS